MADLPEGVVLQHTLYGDPKADTIKSMEALGIQPAPLGGVPYDESLDSALSHPPKKRRVADEPG